MSLAVGAAGAAASLGVGSAQAAYPGNFQGYEPGDPQTWVNQNGSSLTIQPNGAAYGTGAVPGLSESNFGLLDPSTSGLAYGQYAGAGFNKLPPGDDAAGNSSWPGQTFQFQAFVYLSNQWTTSSANNTNDIAWLPVSINEDLGGGNFTYAHAQSYRVKRTAGNTAAGTFTLYEAGTGNAPGTGNIPAFTVPGDNWYGIHEVYEIDQNTGNGRVTGSWIDTNGNILNGGLATFTIEFNGVGVASLPGTSFAGFRTFFPNFIDTSTNIDELGIPLDNVAVLLGSTPLIPPLTPIPEPASLALLGAGAAMMLRRRRREE
jgi:hypothetical protein